MSKLFYTLLGIGTALTIVGGSTAGTQASPYYGEFGVCCSEQIEVEITPFALVEGARQGQFVEQGIPGFATFDQKVALKDITAEDLVRAAYYKYRATYDDLVGNTDMIDEVDQYLKGYQMGRN